jgi:hypothetical protein
MLRICRAIRLGKPLNRSSNLSAKRRVNPLSKQTLRHAFHVMGPTLTALLFAGVGSGVAHAQGTMDFSGAQTLMGTFKTRPDGRVHGRGSSALEKNLPVPDGERLGVR